MRKNITTLFTIIFILITLSGCSSIGDKTGSMSIIYGATSVLALLLLIGYGSLVHKKNLWFFVLFISVFVVNMGYFSISVSHTLEEALLANRIAYLGSVFLPLAMLMIILDACKQSIPKWGIGLLLGISISIFFIAASPGYLNIYYSHASIETINGSTVLNKTYGSWHCVYLFYLIIYFSLMIISIVYANLKKRISSYAHALILSGSVLINIGVWLLEQIVNLNFEILSISYIISELFLLSLYLLIQETAKNTQQTSDSLTDADTAPETVYTENTSGQGSNLNKEDFLPTVEATVRPEDLEKTEHISEQEVFEEKCNYLTNHLYTLTPTEHTIYECYLAGKSTKDILQELNIKENTLKYHNKNIYSKLNVSSRKELIRIAKHLEQKSAI